MIVLWTSIKSFTRSLSMLRAVLMVAGLLILIYGIQSLSNYGITWDENKGAWITVVVGSSLIVSQIGSHLHDLKNPD